MEKQSTTSGNCTMHDNYFSNSVSLCLIELKWLKEAINSFMEIYSKSRNIFTSRSRVFFRRVHAPNKCQFYAIAHSIIKLIGELFKCTLKLYIAKKKQTNRPIAHIKLMAVTEKRQIQ